MNFPTEAEFRAWLQAMPPERVVAENWGCYDCPIALFLRERGAPRPYVSPSRVRANSGRWLPGDLTIGLAPMPEWANDFARLIDGSGPSKITAADCLRVLGP
jgi:hypothetical protein